MSKRGQIPHIRVARKRRENRVFISGNLGWLGGAYRDRTDDPLLAKQVLSQLSYTPEWTGWWVWLDSNQRPPPYQDGALTS